jgi:Ribbon-helix-helix protein, copG family
MDLIEALELSKARTGASMAEIVRRALVAWLVKSGDLKLPAKGMQPRKKGPTKLAGQRTGGA